MAVVHVPPGEATKTAQELLRLAEEKGYPPSVVATQTDGLYGFSFVVPDDLFPEPEPPQEPEEKPEPKKRGRPKKAAAAAAEDEEVTDGDE